MKIANVKKAREVYSSGGNVTEFLRHELGVSSNTSEIIELAYDLQAGSYIKRDTENPERAKRYASEQAKFLAAHMDADKTLLDVGTGELTALNFLIDALEEQPKNVFGFDISWSRLHKGLEHIRATQNNFEVSPFVADMKAIPLPSNSVDIITSSHALEPNGGNLEPLLKELLRVCSGKLVLFEPSYELSSDEAKARMDKLGYIKGLESMATNLGAKVLNITLLENILSPLNPTACFEIEAPKGEVSSLNYCVPGTNHKLALNENFWFSEDTGLAYPELKNIPIFTAQNAVLASALSC